ncbi:hypothetical protein [uncultured Desulfobacter sp.]|uniref:c-type cytochrome n=1 Tax=uncultured Desulfobacter sp. TaxID=240139 RepID=UPI0029F51CD4|nr:hypothetical protein [uncultured Desulfobacter sp.]
MTGKKTNKNKGSQDSDEAVFNPPDQEGAPDDIREAVLLGYKIMTETPKYAGHYIGNDLVCINCHFDGGRSKDSILGGGGGATYPGYRSRRDYAADLTLRTQGCFERSMTGTARRPQARSCSHSKPTISGFQRYFHYVA